MIRRALRAVVWTSGWVVALGCAAWAFGALYYDFPMARTVVAWLFAGAIVAAVILLRGNVRKLGAVFFAFALVLIWWLTLKPSNDGNWQPDVAQLAWADINGDEFTFHNVRNCDYRTDTDYTPHWETRTVRLSQITGIDLAIDYWGSPWIAHPIVSFQFTDAPPLCFSIETRKTVGQSYSTIGGLYRLFTLIYLVSDERDVIRLRTNYRHENIYLYHTTAPPDRARWKCARTRSASSSSSELECVFFSVTPTWSRTSRIALLLTSSSRAKSLIRTLLIRPFYTCPRP